MNNPRKPTDVPAGGYRTINSLWECLNLSRVVWDDLIVVSEVAGNCGWGDQILKRRDLDARGRVDGNSLEPADAHIHLPCPPQWIAFAPSGWHLILWQADVTSPIAGIALGVEDAMVTMWYGWSLRYCMKSHLKSRLVQHWSWVFGSRHLGSAELSWVQQP